MHKDFVKRNIKGFSLMEMLVVVAIIAILVVISYPVYVELADKAKKVADEKVLVAAKRTAVAWHAEDETIFTNKKYYDIETNTFVDSLPIPYGRQNVAKVVSVIWDITYQELFFQWE